MFHVFMFHPSAMWTWWTNSSAGLWTRITIGVLVFAALAGWDYRRNRGQATRWREYLVLVACVLAAMAYGIVNDQITSTISWEYFYYGKDLGDVLGRQIPPDPVKLHLAASIVGIQATWSAGLIIGVALLLANNPSKRLARLPNVALLNQLPIVFLITAGAAGIGATLGYTGLLIRFHEDFEWMISANQWRPRRFMAVYGIHLGGYIGALAGIVTAVIIIRRQRRKIPAPATVKV
jgi:hypothetical protein